MEAAPIPGGQPGTVRVSCETNRKDGYHCSISVSPPSHIVVVLLFEEIDHDPHAVFDDHAMGHFGRNCLFITDDEVDCDWRVRVHCETDRTLQYPEHGPPAVSDSMVGSQAHGQGRGVEGPGSPNDMQTVRDFCPVAKRALEVQDEVLGSTRLGQRKGAVPQRWPVAHMLSVQTL